MFGEMPVFVWLHKIYYSLLHGIRQSLAMASDRCVLLSLWWQPIVDVLVSYFATVFWGKILNKLVFCVWDAGSFDENTFCDLILVAVLFPATTKLTHACKQARTHGLNSTETKQLGNKNDWRHWLYDAKYLCGISNSRNTSLAVTVSSTTY
jgi:hypothetical protein